MGQSHTYIDAVYAAGGLPLILPMTHDQDSIDQIVDECDGFLFAGGNDIDPKYYREEITHAQNIDELRDEFETTLLQKVDASDKPLFAICRGMQLLNVVRGGTLFQDIEHDILNSHDHHSSTKLKNLGHRAHVLNPARNSMLRDLVKSDELYANTHHHQAVRQLGARLVATAWAEDGIIEAIEDRSKTFAIGVQCHPESLYAEAEPRWANVFRAFVDASRCNNS